MPIEIDEEIFEITVKEAPFTPWNTRKISSECYKDTFESEKEEGEFNESDYYHSEDDEDYVVDSEEETEDENTSLVIEGTEETKEENPHESQPDPDQGGTEESISLEDQQEVEGSSVSKKDEQEKEVSKNSLSSEQKDSSSQVHGDDDEQQKNVSENTPSSEHKDRSSQEQGDQPSAIPPSMQSMESSSYVSESPPCFEPAVSDTCCSEDTNCTKNKLGNQQERSEPHTDNHAKKKRISRFVNIGKSPIMTRNTLKKRMEMGNQTELDTQDQEIFVRLNKSVRALNKQARERKGIKHVRPKKKNETMDIDLDLEKVEAACSFSKMEEEDHMRKAESRNGDKTNHQRIFYL